MTSNVHLYQPRKANPLYHIAWGMRFFFAGLRMLVSHPSLLALSLVPIALTVVLLLSMAFGSALLAGQLFSSLAGDDLKLFAQVLIFLFALLLGYFLYLPVARVLLAPFAEAISRKTHGIATGNAGFRSDLGWVRAIIEGLKIALLHLGVAAVALIFGLIFPPVGTPLGIVLAIFLSGLDFLDVPLSARGIAFRKKLSLVWRNKSVAFGFGAASYLLLLIPGVNLLSLPVGVIGATLLTDQLDLT